MKFDVTIGNPPYQGDDGQSQIYPKFGLKALELSSKHTALVVPTRWYNGNTEELNKFRQEVLEAGLKELVDYTNSEDVFDNVQIMGGVCYYHTDKSHTGDTRVVNKRRNQEDSVLTRPITFSWRGDNIIIRDNTAVTILNKVKQLTGDDTFDMYVITKDIFKLSSTDKGSEKQLKDYIPVYITGNSSKYRGGVIRYFSPNQLSNTIDYLNKHKVLLFAASDNMLSFPFKVLNRPLYAPPGVACNQSFIYCGPFSSEAECKNVIKYLCTKFARSLIHIRKMSQNTSLDVYKFLPIQDFSIHWTDKQLYEKYKLTPEEIAYIESNFKNI